MYKFSERLAWIGGILIPAGETLRRWGTWWVYPPAYLDDLLIGAFLLLAAWISGRRLAIGHPCLTAAYGFAMGVGFMSLAENIMHIDRPDPTGASGTAAVLVKSVLMALAAVGLIGAIRGPARAAG